MDRAGEREKEKSCFMVHTVLQAPSIVQIEMQIEIQRVIHIVIGIDDVTW